MELSKVLAGQLAEIREKSKKNQEYCDKHQESYFYSCSLCENEAKELEEKAYRVTNLLAKSGIKKRFEEASFANFKPENNADVTNLKLAKHFAQSFLTMKELGVNIIMHGNTGNGKNHLAVSIMRDVITNHCARAKITKAYNLINDINETYSSTSSKTERQLKKELSEYDLLIIDEFDLTRGKETDHLQLFDVINDRYEEMKPTVIISNLSRKELEECAGQRIMSRLLDSGIVMKFTGFDRRKVQGVAGMSIDNLIQSQVQEALEPVLSQLYDYVEKFSKTEDYKEVRITSLEAARLLGKSPITIHNYVENGKLTPVDPASRYKYFTLDEIERFKKKNGGKVLTKSI